MLDLSKDVCMRGWAWGWGVGGKWGGGLKKTFRSCICVCVCVCRFCLLFFWSDPFKLVLVTPLKPQRGPLLARS